ncbi:hypothetical protein [Aeromicrobium duanguangcaii]|uniref:DUF4175 domain-containing protein n=1 Tax=Aeromicrobium duanguangcaii TaxID=2968086 RepID=A0ABY5KFZ5_9ACTN|nr:hypothetical protein [Aeromicrobium duanguangcaii]MCD9153673.1 hypothetical protein [Aeromicrobium duanguangcaii]MCL3836342.1 hypothetical protein [Aeromicrobium duanguangcaii]UUI69245.1 hypothetical protein NP095_03830 [Aeromicrobium duanguangcaii]
MWTIRTMGAIALLLAGSTWLWTTPAFAGQKVATGGALWWLAGLLSLVTIVGFCVATVAVFARQPWWEAMTLASAAVGLIALVPYGIAAARGGESTGAWVWNAVVHVLILAGIAALLLVPVLERWVDHHVMGR